MASISWFEGSYKFISKLYDDIVDEVMGTDQKKKKQSQKKPITVPVGKPMNKGQRTVPTTTTTTTTNNKNIVIPIGKPQNNQTSITTFQKKKETVDDFFSRYYTQYNKSDESGKKNFIVRYFASMSNDANKQANEFERLRKLGISDKEINRLVQVIAKLNIKNQFKAAYNITHLGTDKQNKAGRMAVADNYQNYHNTVQIKVLNFLLRTKDKQVISRASTHASELSSQKLGTKKLKDGTKSDITNQTLAVEMFQNTKLTGLDLKNKSDSEFQSIIDKNIIKQYSNFSINSQLSIHETMSASKLSETVKYAASNIGNLDKTNQVEAVKITIRTNNSEAIEAAAANFGEYDKSVQSEIKTEINSSGCDTAKQILSAVENFTSKVFNAASSEIAQVKINTASFNKSTQEKFAEFEKVLKNNPSPAVLLDEIKKMPDDMKLILLKQYSNDSVIVNAIFASGASLELLSKLNRDSLKEIGYKRFIGAQLCFLNVDAQIYIVNACAENGTLSDLPSYLLKPQAKDLYEEKLLNATRSNEMKKRYSLLGNR